MIQSISESDFDHGFILTHVLNDDGFLNVQYPFGVSKQFPRLPNDLQTQAELEAGILGDHLFSHGGFPQILGAYSKSFTRRWGWLESDV